MDINMPGMDGIEASKRILKANPDTRILVLSIYGHKEFVLELMDSGVSGYLLNSTSKDELIEALAAMVSPLFLLKKGKDATLHPGYEMPGTVANYSDVSLAGL
jgi:DNA-binding NarL/FixJ family response regulator